MSTLAQLRSRVRFNLGEVNSEQRFFNESINNHLNEGYQQYQLKLMENGEGDLAVVVNVDLVANQEAYLVPDDWVKMRKLSRVTTFGTTPLRTFERIEQPNVTVSGNSGDWYLPTYRMRGRFFILEPYPTFSQTSGLIQEYYALKPALTADGQSPDIGFIEPWQSMMVLWATIAELEGKEAVGGVADISTFRDRLDRMEQMFIDSMNNRTEARTEVEPYGLGYDYTRWQN